MFGELLLGVVDKLIGLVLELNHLLLGLISFLGFFSFVHHSFDILILKTTRGLDGNILSFPS